MLTLEQITPYLGSNPRKHPYYDESVEIADSLRTHVDGKYSEKLIEVTRPHETPAQKEYRKCNWQPITKPVVNSVAVGLKKINKADDFVITFPPSPPRVVEEETLENYLEKSFPFDDSIRNWFFSFRLFDTLADPNGVLVVLPSNNPTKHNEYIKPYPYFFASSQVWDFVENQFVVLLTNDKVMIPGQPPGSEPQGKVLLFVDREGWFRAEETRTGNDIAWNFPTDGAGNPMVNPHFVPGYMPAIKLGGGRVIKTDEKGRRLYESILSPGETYLNQAIQRHSDLLVQFVHHVHPEQWALATNDCGPCGGKGWAGTEGNKKIACKTCGGQGKVFAPSSPLGITIFTPPKSGNALPGQGGTDSMPPLPHKGYIEKPLAPTELLKKQVQDDIMEFYRSLNLEYAKTTPLVQSGTAKGYDRQEVNGFYYDIARHIIENIIRPVVYFTAYERYGYFLPSKQIDDMLPFIPVPQKFDTFSADLLITQIQSAVNARMEAAFIFRLQIELATKEFGADSSEVKMIELARRHNPLPFMSTEDRMAVKASGGCSAVEYVLAEQFNAIAEQAMIENPQLFDLEYQKQRESLYALANLKSTAAAPTPTPLVDRSGNPEGSSSEGGSKPALVGNNQLIVQFAKSVRTGELSYDAAVANMVDILGISEERAKQRLGTIVVQQAS